MPLLVFWRLLLLVPFRIDGLLAWGPLVAGFV